MVVVSNQDVFMTFPNLSPDKQLAKNVYSIHNEHCIFAKPLQKALKQAYGKLKSSSLVSVEIPQYQNWN